MGRGQRDVQDAGREFGRNFGILGEKFERFRGWKVEKIGEKLDPLKASKSMDQIQQNFITPTNHKKKLGLFLVGIFGFR